MRYIKNFLYNLTDIVLAIVIVTLAAGIIYWRMNIILDYPKQLAAEQAVYQEDESSEEAEETDEEEAGDDAEQADTAQAGQASEDTAADTAEEPAG